MKADFVIEYLGTFVLSEAEIKAHELARQYHVETEAYDRSVCTGPMGRDGILPATPYQYGMINCNAKAVFLRLKKKAANYGIDAKTFQRAVFDAAGIGERGEVDG